MDCTEKTAQDLMVEAFRSKVGNLIVLQPRLADLPGLQATCGVDVNIAELANTVTALGLTSRFEEATRTLVIDAAGLLTKEQYGEFSQLLLQILPEEIGVLAVRGIRLPYQKPSNEE